MAAVAAPVAAELLRFPVEASRAKHALDAMSRAAAPAGVRLVTTRQYRGGSLWLVLWGAGAPDRVEPMRRHLLAGGHVIALDLAYWQRDRKFRVSIDAAHPQAWIMRREWPADRFVADGVRCEQAWNPAGPVLVAGIGDKATVQYGGVVREWETELIAAVRAAGRRVLYRPKKAAPAPPGVERASAESIDAALRGTSCVITWHSNVAVDAIRLGIPVVCRDGAAAAICPDRWRPDLAPLPADVRDRFLMNLAYFQWDLFEAVNCWAWLREALACAS